MDTFSSAYVLWNLIPKGYLFIGSVLFSNGRIQEVIWRQMHKFTEVSAGSTWYNKRNVTVGLARILNLNDYITSVKGFSPSIGIFGLIGPRMRKENIYFLEECPFTVTYNETYVISFHSCPLSEELAKEYGKGGWQSGNTSKKWPARRPQLKNGEESGVRWCLLYETRDPFHDFSTWLGAFLGIRTQKCQVEFSDTEWRYCSMSSRRQIISVKHVSVMTAIQPWTNIFCKMARNILWVRINTMHKALLRSTWFGI